MEVALSARQAALAVGVRLASASAIWISPAGAARRSGGLRLHDSGLSISNSGSAALDVGRRSGDQPRHTGRRTAVKQIVAASSLKAILADRGFLDAN